MMYGRSWTRPLLLHQLRKMYLAVLSMQNRIKQYSLEVATSMMRMKFVGETIGVLRVRRRISFHSAHDCVLLNNDMSPIKIKVHRRTSQSCYTKQTR